MARITFISTDPSNASARRREVSLSEARSHAARVAHHRSRKQFDLHDRPLPKDARAFPDSASKHRCDQCTRQLGSKNKTQRNTYSHPSKAFATKDGHQSILDELHYDQFAQQGEWQLSECGVERSLATAKPMSRSLRLETDEISQLCEICFLLTLSVILPDQEQSFPYLKHQVHHFVICGRF